MKRRHLFEWEDFAWFPAILRDLMTDYLRHVVVLTKMYEPVVPLLDPLLRRTGTSTIIDLASGGGGPWPALAPALKVARPDLHVVLTDLYPNLSALEAVTNTAPSVIEVRREPIDALHVPDHLRGVRTQFLSLHHFQPDQVRSIFENAIQAGQPIAVFEFQERTPAQVIQFVLSPLIVLLLSMTIRPFSLKRFFFTYLVPLVPLLVMWDGVVSVLRTYTPEEVWQIIESIPASQAYTWDVELCKQGQMTIFHAIGWPK
jgi:hypothetical protein